MSEGARTSKKAAAGASALAAAETALLTRAGAAEAIERTKTMLKLLYDRRTGGREVARRPPREAK